MHIRRGVGLIELLVTLAVAAALATIALPSVDRLFAEHSLRSASWRIVGAVRAARDLATTSRRPTILCPRTSDDRCGGDWNGALALFVDRDSDGQPGGDEPAAMLFQPMRGVETRWRGAGGNRIRFAPTGITIVSNGTFRLCRANGRERAVVLNRAGRARTALGNECAPAPLSR